MNRKMRAKLNNKIAKAKKEARGQRCPLADSVVFTGPDETSCDKCGEELRPIAAVLIPADEIGAPPGATLQ